MFEAGAPVARDLGKAHFYYKLAAARGHTDAAAKVAQVAKQLTSGQLEQSRIAATSWKAIAP
jgi:uncharacterized protein